MTPTIKHRPEGLQYSPNRGVIIAKTPELAVDADGLRKPDFFPPFDVIFDNDELRKSLVGKLGGRPMLAIYNGMAEEKCLWALGLEEALLHSCPNSAIGLLQPTGSMLMLHHGAATPSLMGSTALELVCANDILPEPISWLWQDWLARGKVHIMGGAPGTGKTTLAMKLVATITTAGNWPTGEGVKKGNVLIWSGEDDPRDTLVPRLALAGADLSRVFFVGDVQSIEGRRPFDPAKDIDTLKQKFREVGDIALLIVDPIVSAIAGDSHKNAETRRGLQPLVDLAHTHRFALLGITHFTKGTAGRDPLERITGSLAFGAVARVVMVAAKEQRQDSAPPKRLLVIAKSNIGRDEGGFSYDLRQDEVDGHPGVYSSVVEWGGMLRGNAREILAEAENTEEEIHATSGLNQAQGFLIQLLEASPLPAKQIRDESNEAGHAWRTIKRAKANLGIRSVKEGLKGWFWELPILKSANSAEECQQKPLATFEDLAPFNAHLGGIHENT